jgi:hypothetical protein
MTDQERNIPLEQASPIAPKVMRIPVWIRWSIAAAIVIGLPVGYYRFILDWENKPFGHKQVMLALMNWMDMNKTDGKSGTNPFPNVGGSGPASLAAIHQQMLENMEWAKDYGYVPGLRQIDPGNLVLMYFRRPTRWTMHIDSPTIFHDKGWILVPVDFCVGARERSGPGEQSEWVSENEFKQRLKATINYLREKQRPNWETIVAEQTKFLESIDVLGN